MLPASPGEVPPAVSRNRFRCKQRSGGLVTVSRRDFVKTSVLGAVAAGVGTHTAIPEALAESGRQGHASQSDSPKRPIIICANNGYAYVEGAYAFLKGGGDTLDAAVRVVKGPEDDPNDDSVGLGGLPNEDGVVELDSCCMHGPTHSAGSVGGVQNIRHRCLVARKVYEHTGHVMLVGKGAERFAVDLGFPSENLLTEDARKVWMLWKESNSQMDWWGPGMTNPGWKDPYADRPAPKPTMR